jgi:hypothetical protein
MHRHAFRGDEWFTIKDAPPRRERHAGGQP